MGRERVPERVRRGPGREAGAGDVARQHAPDAPRREPSPVAVEEERVHGLALERPQEPPALLVEVGAERLDGDRADRYEALLLALAPRPDEAREEVRVLDVERDELAHAEPGRVERLEEGLVAPRERVVGAGGVEE